MALSTSWRAGLRPRPELGARTQPRSPESRPCQPSRSASTRSRPTSVPRDVLRHAACTDPPASRSPGSGPEKALRVWHPKGEHGTAGRLAVHRPGVINRQKISKDQKIQGLFHALGSFPRVPGSVVRAGSAAGHAP